MPRWFWSGAAPLLLLFVAGCGGPAEDKLMRGKLADLEKITGLFAGVTDEKSMMAAEPQIAALMKQLIEADKKLDELGPERKAAAMSKVEAEYKQATKNMTMAKRKAANAAFGLKVP